MAVDRNRLPYGGRFSRDAEQSGVLTGYQNAVRKLDKSLITRNVKPYEKYGLEQDIPDLRKMSDDERFKAATAAVLKKFKATDKPAKPAKPAKPKKQAPVRPRPAPKKPAPRKPPAKPPAPKRQPPKKPTVRPKPPPVAPPSVPPRSKVVVRRPPAAPPFVPPPKKPVRKTPIVRTTRNF